MTYRLVLRLLVAAFALTLAAAPARAVTDPGFRATFRHLTVDHGLPENTIRAIVEDRLGFLWFGTQSGLARYDGYEMATPWHPAMPRFMVTALLEDAAGTIWIGTALNGLWRLDPRRERGSQVIAPDAVPAPETSVSVSGLAADPDGGIWVAWSAAGLCRVEGETLAVAWVDGDHGDHGTSAAHPDAAPPSAHLSDVLLDAHGRLWLASSDAGLHVWDPAAGRWRSHRHDPGRSDSIPADAVQSLLATPDGRIWVLTSRGLALWLPQRRAFQVIVPRPDGLPMHNYLMDAVEDGAGGLWLGSAAGLYHLDVAADRCVLYAHDPDDPRSPVKGPVISVCRDRAGVVWAGSWHAGLNKLDPAAQKFRYLDHDPDDPGSLDVSAVAAVLESADGTLWVGTGSMATGGSVGALNERPPAATGFVRHRFPELDSQLVRTVQALAEDRQGRIWLGTNLGLWRLEGTGGPPRRVHRDASGLAGIGDVPVRSLLCDDAGNLWVGSSGGGLHRLAPDGARSDRFHTGSGPDGQPDPLATPVAIAQDRQRRIWVGTDSQGLFLFDPAAASLERFFAPRAGLATVVDIHEDAAGRIWLGTYGGLLRFDPATGAVVRAVTTDHGLPHSLVSAILEDDRGRLWLSTGRGLCRFDPSSGLVHSYDTRDGLPSNEPAFAHERRRDGTLVFGNAGGLVSFRPESIAVRRDDPPVVLTGLRVGGEPLSPAGFAPMHAAAPYLDALTLPHDRNDLAISFATLHFAHPERHRYRYRLHDDDTDWRDVGTLRTATYTNLAPGRYRFEVQGTNGDGVWSTTGAHLDLVIAPPWWRTVWAYGIYAVVAVLLALVVYRQVVQRERMRADLVLERSEAQKLHDLDAFKTRFFANITHEFRTPLTLLRGPVQRLREDPASGDAELFAMMARNTERLGQLIDQLLDLSRLDARSLPLRFARADCAGFVRDLAASFASLAAARGLEFDVDLPARATPCWFDGDLLEKVVGNLLTNAIKFTPAGETVRIGLEMADETVLREVPGAGAPALAQRRVPARDLRLVVANSGSYIAAGELERIFDRFQQLSGERRTGGSGIGLALVRELVEWCGGTVSATSDPATGTRFEVTLPGFLEHPAPGDDAAPQADDPDDRREDVADPPAADDAAPLVLVVEDHDDLRRYLARELSPTYRLLLAEDGQTGLELALAEIPDLVVSDVMMPRLDGFALCQALREDERTCHVPIVLLTALAEVEKRREGLRHGADAYLAKPFDAEELAIRIENLVAQRRRLADTYAGRVVNLAPEAMPVVSADDRFLQRAREAVEKHLDDEDLQVEDLCREVGLSRSQFHRKLKALTGQSATAFVRAHRLQRAADLLAGGYGNVTEVAYAVGFQSLSYFARCFREQYGAPPSEYPRRDA